jgi:hypothetical protein
MANRSTNILGRVLRNLTRRGISLSSVQDEEIFAELTQAQVRIFDDISPHAVQYEYTANPVGIIDENTEPVLPAIWDKALEYKATSELLNGKDKQEFFGLFEKELRDLRGSAERTSYENNLPHPKGTGRQAGLLTGQAGLPERRRAW